MKELPPNEYVACALFEMLRVSQQRLEPFVRECSSRLIETIDTSGSIEEARGMWNVLALGAVTDREESRVAWCTAEECIERRCIEWTAYALGVIALYTLCTEDRRCVERTEKHVASTELWAEQDAQEGLCLCLLALYKRDKGRYAETVIAAYENMRRVQSRAAYVFARYMDEKEIVCVYSQCSVLTPDLYMGCMRVCIGKAQYDRVVEKCIAAFVHAPVIQEQDNELYMSLLSSHALYNTAGVGVHAEKLQSIAKRLQERAVHKKEDRKNISIIDAVFSSYMQQE